MILSRQKPAVSGIFSSDKSKKKRTPKLDDMLDDRDFTGALTLLEFQKHSGKASQDVDLWIAYCLFHLGDYKKAYEIYEEMVKKTNCNAKVYLNLACCCFYLGMYKEADEFCQKGPESPLKNRLCFHASVKLHKDLAMMSHHSKLDDKKIEDQLSLAGLHYLRGHYHDALNMYKHLISMNKQYIAINIYIALCYYKMDYFDVSQEVLATYLASYPHSAIGVNLKACNHFRLYDGKSAEGELKHFLDATTPPFYFGSDLIKHNKVVFSGGEGALRVLPPLVDVIHEARLNLAIFHLRQEQYGLSYKLVKDFDPSNSWEYVLKAVVYACIGQEEGSKEHLKMAQQFFQLVGKAAGECDTVLGRQCMASCFFLLKQFDDVLIYLNTIKGYMYNDDHYNFNYAQAKAATGNFKEAEEIFLLIQTEKLKNDYIYLSWLSRSYIRNKRPQLAWELYMKMETSSESFSLLLLIANECYKVRQFYIAAKAFDVLERLDPNPEYWEGKRGACVGLFQKIVAGHEPRETTQEVIMLLRSTTSNPQVEYIVRTIRKWAKENHVSLK